MKILELKDLYDGFRDAKVIKALAKEIEKESAKLDKSLKIMEVCGGHTHSIMKYSLSQILPKNIEFIHGPGCPVCVIPKERINHAIELSKIDDVIVVTLGDMIRVPASGGDSLAKQRANGRDIRSLYTPLDAIKIAKENPSKKVVFFAIGFETTTPMSASVVKKTLEDGITNLFFHINHVLVPPPIKTIMDAGDAKVNAFLAPSHVSVITGSKIYEEISQKYDTPIVVGGFEPVDVMQSVLMLVKMAKEGEASTKNQYSRFVTRDGNLKAQDMIDEYFEMRDSFRWRGMGDVEKSALKLKDEYAHLDAEVVFKVHLSDEKIDDHKLCICSEILKGLAKPSDCLVFKKGCTPSNPLGSCMVSSEGVCNAYFRFGF